MKSIGKYGEYRVMASLLEREVEVYQAIDMTQPDFDLTAIMDNKKIVRIQVKTTELCNKGTNNAIDGIDKEYNILVVVIFEGIGNARFFIMTKGEALALKGANKQLGVTQQRNKKSKVKDALLEYEDKWDIIIIR